MAYDGYSEARKRANKKYMDKLTRVTLWLTPDEKSEIEKRALNSGKSINQYLKDLIFK